MAILRDAAGAHVRKSPLVSGDIQGAGDAQVGSDTWQAEDTSDPLPAVLQLGAGGVRAEYGASATRAVPPESTFLWTWDIRMGPSRRWAMNL